MNELQVFDYKEHPVRMVEQADGPWWVLKDVCEALDISDHKSVSRRLDDDEKGVDFIPTPGGQQEVTVINEPGLYSVILRSNKPEAKAFKRWITHEVLPSIRATGGYGEAVNAKLDAMEARIAALEERQTPSLLQPEDGTEIIPGRAARKRWFRLVNEKLDALSDKFGGTPHSVFLHQIYIWIEEAYDVVLEEERLNTMERLGLRECSTLTAVFYNRQFREKLERIIDKNLSPEYRGW